MTEPTPRRRLCPDDGEEHKDHHEAPPTAADAHARIVEALADPFRWCLVLLEAGAVQMPPQLPAPRAVRQKPQREPRGRIVLDEIQDDDHPWRVRRG